MPCVRYVYYKINKLPM